MAFAVSSFSRGSTTSRFTPSCAASETAAFACQYLAMSMNPNSNMKKIGATIAISSIVAPDSLRSAEHFAR